MSRESDFVAALEKLCNVHGFYLLGCDNCDVIFIKPSNRNDEEVRISTHPEGDAHHSNFILDFNCFDKEDTTK